MNNGKSLKYGTESIAQLGLKIWNLLLEKYKEIDSLSIFKRKMSNWERWMVLVDDTKYTTSWLYLNVHLSFNSAVYAQDS